MKALGFNHSGVHVVMLVFLGVFLCGYFSFHVFYGGKSFARLEQIDIELVQTQKSYDRIRQEREQTEERVTMLRLDTLSKDFMEERVREILGYRAPKEYILKE